MLGALECHGVVARGGIGVHVTNEPLIAGEAWEVELREVIARIAGASKRARRTATTSSSSSHGDDGTVGTTVAARDGRQTFAGSGLAICNCRVLASRVDRM